MNDPCQAQFIRAVAALIEAVEDDEACSGGLLSRSTLRRTGELRQLLAKECRDHPGILNEPEPPLRRDSGATPL